MTYLHKEILFSDGPKEQEKGVVQRSQSNKMQNQPSLEEIVHDVSVVWLIALGHKTHCKHNDGIQAISIVTCKKQSVSKHI